MTREDARRGVVAALVLALALAGCSLDLDRLRAGAGDAAIDASADAAMGDAAVVDAGGTDAGSVDAGAIDAGPTDAGPVPPGCECGARLRWSRTSIGFSGRVTHQVSVADLDRDGDVDFLAAVSGTDGSPVSVLQLPPSCESEMLDLFSVRTHLPAGSTPVPFEILTTGPLGAAIAPPSGAYVVLHRAEGSDATYRLSGTATISTTLQPHTLFAYDVTGDAERELVIGTARSDFMFYREGSLPTSLHEGGARLELAAFDRVSDTYTWLFGAQKDADTAYAIRFVTGTPALPVPIGLGEFALSDIAVGDLDGDGTREVLFLDAVAGTVRVRRMEGTAVVVVRDIPIQTGATAIVVADLLGNGRMELAAARPGANSIDIYTFDAGGGAALAESITLEEPTSLVAEDVDDDGRADLIVGHALSGVASLTIMRQQCR